jgi:phthiocerol/phenolphthiocerol synthesis type-I polyketide synthase E
MSPAPAQTPIAIIGMACRLPGAPSVEAFWSMLREGREGITYFSAEEMLAAGVTPAELADPAYVRAGAVLEDIELFDAEFFGVGAREAEIMDPQHRIFLECAWEAVERAGYDPARMGNSVGVFAGGSHNTYLLHNLVNNPSVWEVLDRFQVAIGSESDYLATRVSYKLNLRGPSVTVQTASSTSMVALHLACRALQAGDCDMALAGGVSVKVPHRAGYKAGGVRSSDGHTRTFDAGAHGTLFGSGVGVVVLKPLARATEDGDHIHAVILGSAVNNDGASKRGFTAPSEDAIAEVVSQALVNADVDPETVTYLEAHGTGTVVGDPVEVAALSSAFRKWTTRQGFCAIGSAKTNVGHPSPAAGVVGLMKAALALEHGEIPPSLNFEQPNPSIDFGASPFYVASTLRSWPRSDEAPRRAGVSALGFGGSNAHVVLQEAPVAAPATPGRPWELVTLSARTPAAREAQARRLAAALRARPELPLADVAHTLQTGRRAMRCRLAVACKSSDDAAAVLESLDSRRIMLSTVDRKERTVAFMFPGHGSEHVNMMRGLYQCEPHFRQTVDTCAEHLTPLLGTDLRSVLYPPAGEEAAAAALLAQSRFTQPALFTVEYALGSLWMHWGIQPDALIGYSIGQYAAACLAGVFELPEALALVARRGQLIHGTSEGAMVAVGLSERDLEPYLGPDLSLAVVSAPTHCIVSGRTDRIEAFERTLAANGVARKRLKVPRAFHSELLEPVLGEFRTLVRTTKLRPPQIPIITGLTGGWLEPAEATDPEHWTREMRSTVRFSDGVRLLAADPRRVFLEAGPSALLGALVRGHSAVSPEHAVISSCRAPAELVEDQAVIMGALGKLWLTGRPIDWERVRAGERRRRVPLPGYPFERQRYWIEPVKASEPRPAAAGVAPPASGTDLRPAAPGDSERSGQAAAATREPASISSGRPRPALGTPFVAPTTPIERRVAGIWQQQLGVSEIGVHDRLFELGGDSLVAVQLISRVRDALRVDVQLARFLESPTISNLSIAVVEALARQDGRDVLAQAAAAVQSSIAIHSTPQAALPTRPPACGSQALPAFTQQDAGRNGADLSFSVFFFSGDESAFQDDRYRLVLEGARFADRHGFTAVWTPERHFDKFGGLYPNPAVLGAALAQATERIQIRAGSVVVPLHHPVRIAEEWAVVDNLSRGRVGLSFAAGFHPHDFALAPEAFTDRRQEMLRGIETFRRLWRGEAVRLRAGHGRETELRVYPRPVQSEPPIWLAATSSAETFVEAGRIGANVLTALLRFDVNTLARHIAEYRESRLRHGHDPASGVVTLMLHTFVGADEAAVRAAVTEPLREYLRSHLEFISPIAKTSEGLAVSEADREALVARAFERYSTSHALIGTPESCLATVQRLADAGVNEIACLIDFGLPFEAAMEGLRQLNQLRRSAVGKAPDRLLV